MRSVISGLLLFSLSQPVCAADPPRLKDQFGDPLPEGAILRLGTTRLRAPISSFGILADGTVVTVSQANEVRTWGPKDDESDLPIPIPIAGPQVSWQYPAVSPDGRLIAACSSKHVFVWERPTDRIKQLAAFEIEHPRYYIFSPDGSKLAVTYTTDRAERICLGEVKSGKVTELAGDGNSFEAMAFSGDGKRLAAIIDIRVLVWDTTDGKKLAEYKTTRQGIRSLALDVTGERMAAVPIWEPKDLQFFETLTGKQIDNLIGVKTQGGWVTFAPDGKTVLAGDKSGVRWWDPVAGKMVRKFEGVAFSGSAAVFTAQGQVSPDGRVLVVQNGSMLLRWVMETGKPQFADAQNLGHAGYVNGLGISPDGKRIATRGMDNRVSMWDATTGKELWKAPASWSNDPAVVFGADGKSVFLAGPKWGQLTKRDAATGRELELFTVDPKVPRQTDPNPIRLSPDGKTLFAITEPRTSGDPSLLTAWDTETGERKSSTRIVHRMDFGCELSRDGRFLANRGQVFAIDDDKQNLAKAANVVTIFRPGQFSDDGRWLTMMAYDADVRPLQKEFAVIIDTAKWTRAATVDVPKNSRLALSPDAKTLAAAADNAIIFYDVAAGKEFARYKVPMEGWEPERMGFTQAIRFTPDGTRLVTGHVDTTALVWKVPSRPEN